MKKLRLNGSIIEKLKILFDEWSVEYTEDDTRVNPGERAWGVFDQKENIIRLLSCDGISPIRVFQTLLHEIVHVMDADLWHLGLKEDDIDKIAISLSGVFLENYLVFPRMVEDNYAKGVTQDG